MSSDRLDASPAQFGKVLRWLRLLVPALLLVVLVATAAGTPRPGMNAIGVALAAFALMSVGVVATLTRPEGRWHPMFAVGLLASSVALTIVQGGAAIPGIFVGFSLILFRLRKPVWLVPGILGLVLVGTFAAAIRDSSFETAMLNVITLGAFYGMWFLAARLSAANRHAERLVAELEASRDAQARAAGMAERQRVAREMHDILAHSLSGLMLQLEGARMLAAADPADPRLRLAVDRAHHLAKSGLDEARRAIGMLRDDDLPGPELLPALAAQFELDHGIPCRLTVSEPAGTPPSTGSEQRLAIYRVAQEALTNIARHATAERIAMDLSTCDGWTRLRIENFGVPAAEAGDGYGLTGMRERAELLGGTLTAEPTPTGFRVELGVPA
ncbi:sensor histidine kinase [Hamadaea tsunoensis]|uniref:sensor histidine kinase n=1 Tax=Hamadaea tsunoensis TaxID=53368 RepID=UPI0004074460|nr:sensor histidine kinase [Hamadaea tsunoensis]